MNNVCFNVNEEFSDYDVSGRRIQQFNVRGVAATENGVAMKSLSFFSSPSSRSQFFHRP